MNQLFSQLKFLKLRLTKHDCECYLQKYKQPKKNLLYVLIWQNNSNK